ncbi:hypothetical protein SLEP1_g51650 [Rubroshorea leprosula]|uniref:Uncharacterized protein n=1 Tax=Rubroshorea leprosula TaxID=152421 RepID=A0AAV5M3V0_9ROSI|nr:hypothetical protein SLEP1_g51650 [Rubroshorea leprosula]
MVHTRSVRAGNSSLPLGQGQPPNNLPPPIPPQIPPQLPPQVPIMFPPVDHAEGGDENQPHVSAHNSTSTANHDVVTAQLAAMQQQFGVFQLVLAQLLARNNPGDPLINLLNPAQQPPAPQQNPQPAQPAPAISESQDQSHIALAQQPIPDDVTRRLDSLEKLIAEHRGAPPPRHATDSIPHPLNTNITLEPYPTGFKIPQLETYDGTKDPDDHLHAFYSCMQAQNASDALMCKIFPSTLRGNARTWYYSLPPRSISSYTEMASAFAIKFSSRRFNDAVLEVSSFDQAVGIAAVISGLKHDRFRDSLIKHAATTFSEVNDRSLKFITAEEYALAQNPPSPKNQNPEWRDDNPSWKRMRMAQSRGPMLTSPSRFGRTNSTPQQQSAVQQLKIRSTNPLKKPVAQKRRLFGGERLQAIKEEVEKLLQAGFVRKVDYCEWVANPVLVKKANGKWRMCIDYTNLNNACPKDCYPMPSIDKLVEAASGNERLSLLDAYSGYHQVPMAPEDEEKTAFYAGDEIYCYVMMPFGLKNAGETPYHLAFGTEAVIPVEIGVPSFRVTHFDEERNGQLLRENLDLLAEVREEARLRTLAYKQKLTNFYNKRVHPRTFKVGDLVLRKAGLTGFETRFGKLAPNWEGPYAVAEVPHPGAYVLQDAEGKRVPRVWNVNNLKRFYP